MSIREKFEGAHEDPRIAKLRIIQRNFEKGTDTHRVLSSAGLFEDFQTLLRLDPDSNISITEPPLSSVPELLYSWTHPRNSNMQMHLHVQPGNKWVSFSTDCTQADGSYWGLQRESLMIYEINPERIEETIFDILIASGFTPKPGQKNSERLDTQVSSPVLRLPSHTSEELNPPYEEQISPDKRIAKIRETKREFEVNKMDEFSMLKKRLVSSGVFEIFEDLLEIDPDSDFYSHFFDSERDGFQGVVLRFSWDIDGLNRLSFEIITRVGWDGLIFRTVAYTPNLPEGLTVGEHLDGQTYPFTDLSAKERVSRSITALLENAGFKLREDSTRTESPISLDAWRQKKLKGDNE